MTAQQAPSGSAAAADVGAARRARIEQIFRRGLDGQRRAYDPERHLVGNPAPWAGGRWVYRPPESLWFAAALLSEGSGENQRTAAAVVAAALDSQELAPRHPHRGNFRWLIDDAEVVDLNAVQFVLRALLPLLIDHGAQLPAALLERCRAAVRLALGEQERMAVAPTYTNIHLMALFSLLAGGEWLGDAHFRSIGAARWDEWVRFTVESGAPHEFNSPGYGAIDLSGLAAIQQYVREPRVRLQARLLYERVWLHLALHFHQPSGQHAGPHCRCYWQLMNSGWAGIHGLLWRETGRFYQPGMPDDAGAAARVPASVELALTGHWLPDVVRAWIDGAQRALPAEVRETSNRAEGADQTTYLTPSYALGTASRTYGIGQDDFYIEHQANYLLLHYARPGGDEVRTTEDGRPAVAVAGGGTAGDSIRPSSSVRRPPGWGMMYSRYVVNDRHFGTLTAASDRPPNAFYDQGNFAGAQLRNKAIALYALRPQHEEVFSLKTVVVFPQAEALEQVWLGDRRVGVADLPVPVAGGEWLVVADGAALIGVRPLEPSCLGREAPMLLERGPEGELWLTIYNYRGPAKRFWDYASLRGAFWRGNLRAGYSVEVAERAAYASAAAFRAYLQGAEIEDTVAEDAASPLVRTVTYRSGGDTIELRYDLWHTQPAGRRYGGVPYEPPALDSPLAVQGHSGTLCAGSATLRTDPRPCWLIAQELDPARRSWIAVVPQDDPTPLRFETPLGVLTAERFGAGRIEWRAVDTATGTGIAAGASTVVIAAVALPAGLQVPAGTEVVFDPQRGTG